MGATFSSGVRSMVREIEMSSQRLEGGTRSDRRRERSVDAVGGILSSATVAKVFYFTRVNQEPYFFKPRSRSKTPSPGPCVPAKSPKPQNFEPKSPPPPIPRIPSMTPTAVVPQNLLSLHRRTLTLGCPILDRLLAGGIPTGAITELVAESGAGKTQLCLQLLLSSLLPPSRGGLASSSIYFHTELFPFPLRRLHSLSLSFTDLPPSPLDQILVRAIHSAEELLAVLDRLDPVLPRPPGPSSFPVGLIVIDSIAALFRADFDSNLGDLKRRSALFFQIAGKLKELAWRHGAAVVVTNQVVDMVGDAGGSGVRVGNYRELWSSGRRVCAALGVAWANCVNMRLFLSRWEETAAEVDERSGMAVVATRTRRRLQVVFAPHLPEGSCEFEIGKGGVAGVEEKKGGLI